VAEDKSINERVLIVEGDARIRDLLSNVLEREGFRCTLATGVSDARTRLELAPYDLIVCDVRSSDGSGVDLVDEARRRQRRGSTGTRPQYESLTPREQQVLQLAADGHSGPEMARDLVVSMGTIKTHFQNIYGKLGARDRASAVANGLRRGLID
jgi:DNA-binding NarL/FixJ family response regulator